jgi:hypothetical protein
VSTKNYRSSGKRTRCFELTYRITTRVGNGNSLEKLGNNYLEVSSLIQVLLNRKAERLRLVASWIFKKGLALGKLGPFTDWSTTNFSTRQKSPTKKEYFAWILEVNFGFRF